MKVAIQETPDTYSSIKCIKNLDNGAKVFKNIDDERNVYYHIALEPPLEEIESPDDIVTTHAFTVGEGETEYDVRQTAISIAKSY